ADRIAAPSGTNVQAGIRPRADRCQRVKDKTAMNSIRMHATGPGRPQVVAITGASAGVGRAAVREFAKQGAHIGLMARNREALEAARREVEASGCRALVCVVDVADAQAVEAAADAIEA